MISVAENENYASIPFLSLKDTGVDWMRDHVLVAWPE